MLPSDPTPETPSSPGAAPRGAPDAGGESFPELEEFLKEQADRHRRLVRRVFFGSLALLISGVVVFIYADADQRIGYVAGGLLLIGFGIFGLIRAGISHYTDVDTKAREDLWVGVAEPFEAEEPGPFGDDEEDT